MVDFSNDVTVSTPAVDVMRIIILEARNNLLESIETYHLRKADGHTPRPSIMKSRLLRLFQEIEFTLKRNLEEQEFNDLEAFVKDFEDTEPEDILGASKIILRVLDTVQLTKIDVKVKLGGSIKERNKAQGWHS